MVSASFISTVSRVWRRRTLPMLSPFRRGAFTADGVSNEERHGLVCVLASFGVSPVDLMSVRMLEYAMKFYVPKDECSTPSEAYVRKLHVVT